MIVKIKDREIKTPDSWNELNLRQRVICYQILFTETGNLLTPEELLPFKRIQIVMLLCNLTEEFMQEWLDDCIRVHGEEDGQDIFNDELYELLTVANFLYNKVEEKVKDEETGLTKTVTVGYEVNPALTFNPFPNISVKSQISKKGKKLYGPHNQLDNISLYELGVTFTLFDQYLETKEEKLINDILAVLYRPSKEPTPENRAAAYHGDIREPYIDRETKLEARSLAIGHSVPPPVKQLLFFFFVSCRQHIISQHPKLFTSKKKTIGMGTDYGWAGLIMGLSGGLENLQAISAEKQTNALMYLSFLEEQRLKRERDAAFAGKKKR